MFTHFTFTLGFDYAILGDLPDDVIGPNQSNDADLPNGTDFIGVEPFDSSQAEVPTVETLLQNGPTSLAATIGKGGPGVASSASINVSKAANIMLNNNLQFNNQNRIISPPQGPISTAGIPTPATPMLNPGMRSDQTPMQNIQGGAMSTSSVSFSNSISGGYINSNNVLNTPNSLMQAIANGPMNIPNSMAPMGQNAMNMNQSFNMNQPGFGNNMAMMQGVNRLYGNNLGNVGMGMAGMGISTAQAQKMQMNNLRQRFISRQINPMNMQDIPDPLLTMPGGANLMGMERMVRPLQVCFLYFSTFSALGGNFFSASFILYIVALIF